METLTHQKLNAHSQDVVITTYGTLQSDYAVAVAGGGQKGRGTFLSFSPVFLVL